MGHRQCVHIASLNWTNIDMTTMGQRYECNTATDDPANLDWFRDTDSPLENQSPKSSHSDMNKPLPPSPEPQDDTTTDVSNVSAKTQEESTMEALLLKRKELKWKLMQASQAQNKLKLDEYKTAYNYHKQKLSKAEDLAAKLRSKYLKVVKSAKLSEEQFKKVESQLSLQERHVAEQKMQSTRLALDCVRTGSKLYGTSYKLPTNVRMDIRQPFPNKQILFEPQQRPQGDKYTKRKNSDPVDEVAKREILKKLSPFLRKANSGDTIWADPETGINSTNQPKIIKPIRAIPLKPPVVKRKKTAPSRVSFLTDLNDSVLKNIASYRLTRKFAESGATDNLTHIRYTHNISPLEYVCLPDLLDRKCSNKSSCPYQHKSDYFMTDLEKLTDLLSYRPSVANFRPDPSLSQEENYKVCRVKLKQFAARLISKHSDKPVEAIARDLINAIRADADDNDLLLMQRHLPKTSHLKSRPPSACGGRDPSHTTQ